MKYYSKKVLLAIMTFCLIIGISTNVFAHSGRTDKNGGHKDKNNLSGLGSYHYHCGGHPAHLHKNGVCPYDTMETYSSDVEEVVEARSININESIISMETGETKQLTVKVLPEDTEDKSVNWESSNKEVISITTNGEITALEAGRATVTSTTANGKIDTISIIVNEPKKEETEENIIEGTSNTDENTDEGSGILGVGIVGGATYLGYKKYKNSKKQE